MLEHCLEKRGFKVFLTDFFKTSKVQILGFLFLFLQRVSIACYAERCTSYSKSVRPFVCLSVRLSVTRWHCVKTTQATIMRSSLEDSPMTLVSSRLTSPQNSKGNMGNEGAK